MKSSDSGSSSVRLALAAYRWLLVLLPRDFRMEYGPDLEACFAEIAAAARQRGVLPLIGATLRALADLVAQAVIVRVRGARAGRPTEARSGGGVWQDLRHGVRRLRRHPGFALTAVLTLGLGLAATTSVFSLVHGVVLRPLPYPDADRLVQMDHGATGLGIERGLGVTYGVYRFYAERATAAEATAMYSWTNATLTGVGDPVRLAAISATPSLGVVLGVRPSLGRWLVAADAEPGAPPVVVLSHELWRTRFDADPAVVGRSVRLDGILTEVVGVAAREFAFPSADAELWQPRSVPATGVGGWNEMAVARLAPGASPLDLEREMTALLPVLRETTDDPARMSGYLDDAGVVPRVVGLKEQIVGDVRATLWILLGAVGLVLLIALANVANLFLVRAEESRRDTAVRAALGASSARLLRERLAESLCIAFASGLVGLGAAQLGVQLLRDRAPVDVPRLADVGLHPWVVAASAGAALALALLLGSIRTPLTTAGLSAGLKEGAQRATAPRHRRLGREALVTAQVGLALMLLVGSALLLRTFQRLRHVELGFSERQALTFQIGLSESAYPTNADMLRFHEALRTELAALPGVERVGAVAQCLPLTPSMCWGETLEAAGFPTPAGEVPPVTGARLATTGYFETLGIQVRGRGFTAADESSEALVAVLSEAAARAYFGEVDPLGQRVRFAEDGPWYTVVGVAANVRGRAHTDDFLRTIYLPANAASDGPPPNRLTYVLKTSVPPQSVLSGVRRVVQSLDPMVPVADVESLAERITAATASTAFALALVGLAAVLALLLGAIGIYAVVAYAVSRRTREIGVRMAVGARAADVRRMVIRQGGVPVAIGVAAGLLGAVVLSRLMRGLLYGISPLDSVSYLGPTVVLLGVAVLALYVPARRASRVSPLQALRTD
ncbi:MAG: ABC transporter permease [Gemmatimonadota bacterium]